MCFRDGRDQIGHLAMKQRFLIFSAMELDYNYKLERPEPTDNGYYFTFVNSANQFIHSFFNFNGFRLCDNNKATVIWNNGNVKT